MPRVTRHATEIAYEVTGEGPPVVLTHSFLLDRSMWRHQAEALADSHRVVSVDLRGHGASGPAHQPFSLYDLADDVVAVLDDAGVDSAVWAGLSIGGMLSLRATLRHPERVSALALLDTHAGPEEPLTTLRYRAMAAIFRVVGPGPLLGQLLPLFLSPSTRRERPGVVAELEQRLRALDRPSVSRGVEALVRRDDLRGELGGIDVPALVLVGEDDAALPPAYSRELAAGLPEAELEVIPDAGHITTLEAPERVTGALTGFLTTAAA